MSLALLPIRHRSPQAELPLEMPDPPDLPEAWLVARTLGQVEWMCPGCQRLHRTRPTVNGRLACDMLGCKRKWLVGFVIGDQVPSWPPWNGLFDPEPISRDLHNCWDDGQSSLAACRPLVTRLAGPIEWRCRCGQWNYQYADWTTGQIGCLSCFAQRYVRVILRACPTMRIIAPLDWTSYVETAFPRRQRAGALGSRGRRLRGLGVQPGWVAALESQRGSVDGGHPGDQQ